MILPISQLEWPHAEAALIPYAKLYHGLGQYMISSRMMGTLHR